MLTGPTELEELPPLPTTAPDSAAAESTAASATKKLATSSMAGSPGAMPRAAAATMSRTRS